MSDLNNFIDILIIDLISVESRLSERILDDTIECDEESPLDDVRELLRVLIDELVKTREVK